MADKSERMETVQLFWVGRGRWSRKAEAMVIESCRANVVNLFDLMLALVSNADAVRADPWNYRQAHEPADPPAPP